MSETPLGRFCWFDLMTTDPESAPEFYGAVVGWATAPHEGGDEPYTMWMNDGVPLGGVVALPEEVLEGGASPHWLPYVSTPHMKKTTEKAKELGATVMMETDVRDVGSIAVIADPQGATFAAFEPLGQTPGHDGPPEPGWFSWHELYSDDHEAALSFYSELFGWNPTDRMDMGDAGIYQMYGLGEQTLGGMMSRTADMPPLTWLLYVHVDDIEAAAEAVKASGGEVWTGPMEVPGGDFVALCRDPQGADFAVHASGQERR